MVKGRKQRWLPAWFSPSGGVPAKRVLPGNVFIISFLFLLRASYERSSAFIIQERFLWYLLKARRCEGAAKGGVQEAGAPHFPPRFSVFPTQIGAARRRRTSTNKLMKHLLILH